VCVWRIQTELTPGARRRIFRLSPPRLFPIEFKCAAGHSGSREKRRVGVRGPKEVSMADLPEAINPERKAQIDTVGWLFLAFAIVTTATAAMIVYEANDAMVAPPVSHVAAR